jgi:predicted Fe-S protein YdhL (DUF1289 family)
VIETPCIKVCVIAPASGLCYGCGRSLDEIARWGSMSADERRRIMEGLKSRMNLRLSPTGGEAASDSER